MTHGGMAAFDRNRDYLPGAGNGNEWPRIAFAERTQGLGREAYDPFMGGTNLSAER